MTIDQVFNTIVEEFSEDRIPGWCPLEKALDLAATVVALRPKVVIEIGVFGGKSLLPMALACAALECGKVIGIDPWCPKASVEGYSGENALWWSKLDHEKIFRGFVTNVDRLGVTAHVEIQRVTSNAAKLPQRIDLWHADAQHTTQTTRDIRRFAPLVRCGGIAVLDDLDWSNGQDHPVTAGIAELRRLGFIELYRTKTDKGHWGVFQRIKVGA